MLKIPVCAHRLTMETEVMASFLAPGDAETEGRHVLAWVNDMKTGQPVEDAKISLWRRNRKVM